MTEHRVIIDVDARGRVSLARFGIKATQLAVDSLPDGGLVLNPAVALTPAEANHYQDPSARTALEHGFADAQAGRVRRGELRSDSTATPKVG
ncbi:MAG: hypothetical protein ACC658_04810 [Acidimicrobiia bacterium]